MNKLNVFFSIIFLLIIKNSFAQVTQQWVNYYNSPTNSFDVSRAIATDNSGNIYVTGVSPSSTTGEDYATVKYNSAGVQQWTARYSAANSNDVPSGIIVDGLGNVIVTGSTTSPGRITTIKYNSSGIQQWVAKKGDSSFASVASRYKSSIALDNSGNIYICGGTETYSTDNGSYLLIKYNANGDSLWSRTYDGTQFLIGLGSAASVVKVRGNNVYITGKSFDMNPNLTFATTIKYDLNGIMEWIRKDTLAGGIDNVTDMDIDAFGNVILVSNYGLNIVTIKYNSAGIRLWKIYYNGIA
ncbi:MAG: SBBP repeat-containing protein, partial [Ignavibacteria bacterium]|nr:SBBP repeat-containing protein [Ignavibacteria bacterium]